MLNHYHSPQETHHHRINGLQARCSDMCGRITFECLVLKHLKDIKGAPAGLRGVCSEDAVCLGLHFIVHHLDHPGTHARILFVDFSLQHHQPRHPPSEAHPAHCASRL
ncbi:hypothetical protein ATANTOWER_009431 [Ataeniobius toweri]|uniref:Uncharacterized protein n=1 Tax=Ataeniobius toweri TaxID=208326 RepID=A0ABU7BXL3_9TELE|nr:hypothetical protein [Ataeniobius toweri]